MGALFAAYQQHQYQENGKDHDNTGGTVVLVERVVGFHAFRRVHTNHHPHSYRSQNVVRIGEIVGEGYILPVVQCDTQCLLAQHLSTWETAGSKMLVFHG